MPIVTAPALPVTEVERVALRRMASSTVLAHRQVVQARGLLLAADGVSNQEIARQCGVDSDAVRRWRARFALTGVDGVGVIAKGRGRKASLPEGTVAEIVRVTCHETPPDTSTHWTTRSLAKRFGVGKDTIAQVWSDHQLTPWKVDTFKVSTDPLFEEKTQCQAMDRTQPSLPMVPGRAGTMTHDYKRNGTTDMFAAMNVATGEVLTNCQKGHTGKDVLRFFKQIDASVPRGLAVHVILDNLSAHKTPEIAKWLAHRDRRRWHLHLTPTSSSWTNLIERWFKELTDRRLRRGTFTSVAELEDAIQLWTSHWNQDPTPFIWKATAADIIEKVQRGRATLNRQINSKTDH